MQNPNVTNGAYTFVKYAKGQYVELSANKEYYLGMKKEYDLLMLGIPFQLDGDKAQCDS